MENYDIEYTPRRKFLATLIAIFSSVIAVALGAVLAGFGISPALKKKEEEWIEVGGVSALEADKPKEVVYYYLKKDGWLEKKVKGLVYVIKKEGNEIAAMSPTCTHLGCEVKWNEERREFLCPCHGGVYDINGKVASGPPPKPLSRYKIKFENEMLYILKV